MPVRVILAGLTCWPRRHPRDRQVSLLEEVGLTGPAGRQQAGRQAGETAGHHAEHERAGPVQPRQVVDHHQQRLPLGPPLKQRQHRGGDQQLRGRRPRAQVKRHVQRPGQHRAQLGHVVEARAQELVQAA